MPLFYYLAEAKKTSRNGPTRKSLERRSFLPSKIRCFYFSSFCLITYQPYNKSEKTQDGQRLFIFEGRNPLFNGDIYINEFYKDGKLISEAHPITKSSYVIIGFSSGSLWPLIDSPMLLRIDYLNTDRQFAYELPNKARALTCYYLRYIEYSNYFMAGFTNGNGVLAYDLTKSTKLPTKRLEHGISTPLVAYLEASRVVLVNPSGEPRLYGYGFLGGNSVYHITLLFAPQVIVPFKSSDFYAVISSEKVDKIQFYNLGSLITVESIRSGTYSYRASNLIFSEYFGNLFFSDMNYLVKLTTIPETLNPSCQSVTASKFSFTNYNCSACSSQAKLTGKGVCELVSDAVLYPYVAANISSDLPVNTQGQKLELKLRSKSIGLFWSGKLMRGFLIFCAGTCTCALFFGCLYGCKFILSPRKKQTKKKELPKRSQARSLASNQPSTLTTPAPINGTRVINGAQALTKALKNDKRGQFEEKKQEKDHSEPLADKPQKKIDDLEKKIERLQKENQSLQKQNQQEKEDLKAEYAKFQNNLERREERLQDKVNKLEKEREALGLDEIQEGLPIENLDRWDSQIIPFQNIEVKKPMAKP